MEGISSAKEMRIKKNRANILNEKQCKAYIKDCRDYIEGKISQIKHPNTRAPIKDVATVKYLYNKCSEKYELGNSMPSSSISKITKMMNETKTSNSTSPKSREFESYENDIYIKSNDDILDILNFPINTFKNNRVIIKRLFVNNISDKKGLAVLKEHLNDPNNNSDYGMSYREYIKEIAKYIPIYNPFMDKRNLTKYILEYYNPNNELGRNRLLFLTDYCQKVYISAIFQDTRNINMGHMIYDENYRAVSTPNGFFARLSQNRYFYYALYYIHDIFMSYINDYELTRNFILIKGLIRKLLDKDFVIEDRALSVSFSKSSSSSKSSDMKKRGSNMNNIYRQFGKKEFVKYIMNNGNNSRTVNNEDPYLALEWEKMSINKLRMVVKIPTTINGQIFTYAFDSKSLYKDWKNAIRDRKPFINPFTRMPFSLEDERKILEILEKKYPTIKKPSINPTMRFDIYYEDVQNIRENGVYYWRINIWYNYGTRETPAYIKILCINIISELDIYYDDTRIGYNPTYLFDNINRLKMENKIISKQMPFKLHPAFMKYYNSYITTEEQYLDFFRLINR
jgi:hypothetical protein